MNPLRPSPRLLRRIAAQIIVTSDRGVLAWIDAVRALPKAAALKRFPRTSVVRTFRNQRLCGYEVWRHIDTARNDPARKKARLWFGCGRYGRRTLQLAYFAASTISKMSQSELREWWSEYSAARSSGRPVGNLWRDESRFHDGLDYSDLQQMSHAFSGGT